MTLHTESRSLERILMMGSWGSGKSEAWCSIAKWLAQGKSENLVYVLDTDMAVARLVEGQSYEDKVVGYDLFDWSDFMDSIEKVRKSANPNRQDWLVVDLVDKAWEEVRNDFVRQVHGKNAEDFFLEWKKSGANKPAIGGDYGADYAIINPRYAAFMGQVQRFPGHVLCCTPVDAINRDTEKSKEILETYGRFGVKPRGQKALGHQFHTLLLANQKGPKEWVYTTIKDRKRDQLSNEKVADFVTSYLVKVAGWKL